MSNVTNTILAFSILENVRARFDDVNAFAGFEGRAGFLWTWEGAEEGWVGGTKNLEQPTFIAAFNYFDEAAFLQHIKTIKWEEPEDVQVMLCLQDSNRYELFHPCE